MMRRQKQGMAIPLVLLFVLMIGTFLMSMAFTRSGSRKQSLASHTQKKAYYMAMGGIQHALLKLRLLHREAYDAGCVSRGICPFFNPYERQSGGENLVTGASNNKSLAALGIFMSDLNSASCPLKLTGGTYPLPQNGGAGWRYEVSSFTVLTYFTKGDGTVKEVSVIQAMGYAFDPRDQVPERREFVLKQVELQRKIK